MSAPLLLAACNDTDPLPVFFDLNYQVGCVRPECTAVFHEPERIVMALNGEAGFTNRCSAQDVDGALTVSLSSSNGNSQSFAITGALVGLEGNVGSSCVVEIIEGANRYRGACSSAAPTPQVPCQLTGGFDEQGRPKVFGKNSNGLLEGAVYCDNLHVFSAPNITRDVARAGSFGNCRNTAGQSVDQRFCPATLLVEPCDGL